MRNLEIPLDIPCLVGCPKEGRIETRSSACKKVGIIDGVGDTLVGNWQIGYMHMVARNSKNSNDNLSTFGDNHHSFEIRWDSVTLNSQKSRRNPKAYQTTQKYSR